jgi:hypothetical protein
MTRVGSSKAVDREFAEGRLKLAKAFLKAAQDEMALAEDGIIGNPIISQIINSAIAYTDAVTAKFSGRVNQKDHAAAVKVLRDALGERLPDIQERRLRRILTEKDAVQYGARAKRLDEAVRLLGELEEFAAWAEGELGRVR